MILRPPRSTPIYTPFPCTALIRPPGLTGAPFPSNRAPSQWTPHPGEAAVAHGIFPAVRPGTRRNPSAHSRLETDMSKRQSAKYKLDRRMGENIWGRPKSPRSEEHTSELQSLMRISYAVFCLKKKKKT